MVGLDGLEPTTSVLSGPRSNRLSYRPTWVGVANSHLQIIATGHCAGKAESAELSYCPSSVPALFSLDSSDTDLNSAALSKSAWAFSSFPRGR